MIERTMIEDEIPLAEINKESARDKSLRHGHVSTMHLWWAPRPLPMSRAVVFSSLVPGPASDDERKELHGLVADAMPFERSLQSTALDRARKRLRKAWPDRRPQVLDCFAGRGIIPLEAMRLGCDVTAVELNPVAHLIERAILEFPSRWNDVLPDGRHRIVADFLRWASRVREVAEEAIEPHFPAAPGERAAVYFWARTMPCSEPSCRRTIPLIKSRRFVDSARHVIRVDYQVLTDRTDLVLVHQKPPPGDDWTEGTVRASAVTCPACGTTQPASEVRRFAKTTGFGETLFAVMVTSGDGRERRYRTATDEDRVTAGVDSLLSQLEDCPDGTSALPDEGITKSQFRILRSLVYGIDTFRGLFTSRQLLVLGTLAAAVRQAHDEMLAEGEDPERARALATYLAFVVDKIADYNSSFCSWHASGEKIRNTFPQQAVRMAWDFTEVNPFSDASGSFDGAVRWIELAMQHCCAAGGGGSAAVTRGNAQALEFPDGTFDAVITDPPYYDAVQYGDLSDFFYVWLKRSIGHLYPELFGTPLTPKRAEVIETRADKKSPEYVSHEEFDHRLATAIGEMARVVKDDGIVAIVFAHTDVEAWERLLRALRAAGLVVTTSWPMRSEMSNRPTAQISAVLGSSVVLVCRKEASAGDGYYDDIVQELDRRIEERLAVFEEMQLVGADYFVSAVGPAFEVFAKHQRVLRLSGQEVGVDELMVLARQAVAKHAARRLLGGESLAALDDRDLCYLTWRWAYDGESIPADEAYKLGRAFDLDFQELARPGGMIKKSGDTFTLLDPQDRRDIPLGSGASLVDVLHVACQLHDQGRRKELADLLGESRAGTEPGFWALAAAVAETLPDGNRERTMLLGLTANREALEAAASHTRAADTPSLFGPGRTPPMFGVHQPDLSEGSPQ